MPLLGATGAVADHICAVCGLERHFTSSDWLTTDAPDMMGTPPCPTCTSQEWFTWHDWTYVSSPRRPKDLAPEEKFDTSPRPDADHFGARQMVLIARVAQAKGRSQRKIRDQPPGRSYDKTPRAPTANEVRAEVAKMRRER